MTVLARRPDGVEIDDDPARLNLERTHHLVVEQGYWATDRTPDRVAASVPGSWVFGVYEDDAQIGFARAVTDRVTFAWICDVVVDEVHRGRGIGTWLAATVVRALDAAGVPRALLATRDAHEVYARCGFTPLADPERWMERDLRTSQPLASSPIVDPARA